MHNHSYFKRTMVLTNSVITMVYSISSPWPWSRSMIWELNDTAPKGRTKLAHPSNGQKQTLRSRLRVSGLVERRYQVDRLGDGGAGHQCSPAIGGVEGYLQSSPSS